MQLPNIDLVEVSCEKIVEYLLNLRHPDGAGKATFFLSIGFEIDRWEVLSKALRELVKRSPITMRVDSPHGSKYIVDGELDSPSGRLVTVRTVWIVDSGNDVPRLVTAYPTR